MSSLSQRSPAVRSLRLGPAVALLAVASIAVAACGAASTASPSGSTTPAPSVGRDKAMEALAATIPTQVGDATLTVGSGDATYLSDKIPNYDQFLERLQNASIQPADIIVAVGRPASGTDPTVAGVQVFQAPPGGLGWLAFMQAWTADIQGATTENTNLGGKPVAKVSFADGSAPLYYYLLGSTTMYLVRTADEALATDALSQLP